MGEKSVGFIAQHRAIHDALHVTARGYFNCGNLNLSAVIVCIGNGGAVDDPIDSSPQGSAHAHRAGFAGGVEGVAGERKFLKPLGGEADGPDFGVRTWIEILRNPVECAE